MTDREATDAMLRREITSAECADIMLANDPPEPPWFDMFVAFFGAMLVAIALHGCASPMQSARIAANTAADIANVGGQTVLSGYCAAQMGAQHRVAHWTGEHCVTEDHRVATEDERAAIAAVRAQWAPVIVAHDALAAAHTLLVDALNAAGGATDSAALLRALGDVAKAYEALRAAALVVGVRMPDVLGGAR